MIPIEELGNVQFNAQEITNALEFIKANRLNRIHCGLSGVTIGYLDDSEVTGCLTVIARNDPLGSAENYVDEFQLRSHIYSSGAAPVFRFTRDRDLFLSILKSDPRGANKMFGYMAGRFFFDTLVAERLVDSSEIRFEKLQFLIALQDKLGSILEDWWQSLTPEDELDQSQTQVFNELQRLLNMGHLEVSESKYAQQCFEVFVQLDATRGLRNRFYSAKLKKQAQEFTQLDTWSFYDLSKLLHDVMNDSIIQLTKTDKQLGKDWSDARSLTLAIQVLGDKAQRISRIQQKIVSGVLDGRTDSTPARAIMNDITKLLVGHDDAADLSGREKKELGRLLSQLQSDLSKKDLSWSDHRLETYKRVIERQANNMAGVKVIKGIKAIKHTAELMKAAGRPIPQSYTDILNEHKIKLAANRSNDAKRGKGRPVSERRAAMFSAFESVTIKKNK